LIAQIAASHIFETIDSKPQIDPFLEGGEKLAQVNGELKLSGIKFRYPTRKQQQIFDGLDLTIPKGQMIALVGASGSGKSTIVQLLERFYDAEEGTVQLDGHDVKKLNVNWLRQQVRFLSLFFPFFLFNLISFYF
jgi:ATP-binding cassette subfamily B (MDR/TAP) protein 1